MNISFLHTPLYNETRLLLRIGRRRKKTIEYSILFLFCCWINHEYCCCQKAQNTVLPRIPPGFLRLQDKNRCFEEETEECRYTRYGLRVEVVLLVSECRLPWWPLWSYSSGEIPSRSEWRNVCSICLSFSLFGCIQVWFGLFVLLRNEQPS